MKPGSSDGLLGQGRQKTPEPRVLLRVDADEAHARHAAVVVGGRRPDHPGVGLEGLFAGVFDAVLGEDELQGDLAVFFQGLLED